MAGMTNKGKLDKLVNTYDSGTIPTNFYIILYTSATAPTADTNTNADHTQIATGNGYSDGGLILTKGTSYDNPTEDDTNDRGTLQLVDQVWTASGGPIPSSGGGARYAGHTDDNVTVSAREVYEYWDLTTDRSVSDTQTLTLQDCEIRITET